MKSTLAILAIAGYAQSAVVLPRQANSTTTTATSSSTLSTSSSGITAVPEITAPACCFIQAYIAPRLGVNANFWYQTTATQTVATVYQTMLDYGNRTVVANASTSYLPEDQIFTAYGQYLLRSGFSAGLAEAQSALGQYAIPTDLIDYKGGDYAASNFYRPSQRPSHIPPPPTPYNIWGSIGVYTPPSRTASTDGVCATPGSLTVSALDGGTWGTTIFTGMVPNGDPIPTPNFDIDEYVSDYYTSTLSTEFITQTDSSTTSTISITRTSDWWYVQTLAADATSDGLYFMPTEAVDQLTNIPALQSAYPWITDCYTLPIWGEPTVHVAVQQLTDTRGVTIPMLPSPIPGPSEDPTSPTAEPIVVPTDTPQPGTPIETPPEPTDTPPNDTEPPQTDDPPTQDPPAQDPPSQEPPSQDPPSQDPPQAEEPQPTQDTQPVPTPQQPDVDGPDATPTNDDAVIPSPQQPTSPADTGNDDGPVANIPPVVQPTPDPTTVTFQDQTLTIAPVESGVAINDDSTFVNGDTFTLGGGTGSIADQSLVIGSGSETTIIALPTAPAPITPAPAQATVTFADQTFTAVADGSGGVVVDARLTISSGAQTAVDGVTLSADNGNIVVASGSATTTQELVVQTPAAATLTFAGQTHAVSADGSGGLVVDGSITISSNAQTVVDGATLSIENGDLVIASGTATATQDLGEAIMSGLGVTGSGSGASSTGSDPAQYTGSAARPAKSGLVTFTLLLGTIYAVMYT